MQGIRIGVAVPLRFLDSDKTQDVGDQVTLASPIGTGFTLTEKAAVDFETIVGNPISPRGFTAVTIDRASTSQLVRRGIGF